MKIVGVDASLTSTGVAMCIDGETYTNVIQSSKKGVERLIDIKTMVSPIVSDADLVVIEGYAFARPNQAHQIGELGGVLRVMFAMMGLKYIEVAPAALKKFATGKGNANKEAVAVGIFKRWHCEFNNNDEADAFVLAQIGQAYLSKTDKLTGYQREVMIALNSKPALKGVAKKSAAKKQKAVAP